MWTCQVYGHHDKMAHKDCQLTIKLLFIGLKLTTQIKLTGKCNLKRCSKKKCYRNDIVFCQLDTFIFVSMWLLDWSWFGDQPFVVQLSTVLSETLLESLWLGQCNWVPEVGKGTVMATRYIHEQLFSREKLNKFQEITLVGCLLFLSHSNEAVDDTNKLVLHAFAHGSSYETASRDCSVCVLALDSFEVSC